MTMTNVIDISEYQDPAKFDYQAAKSNGIKAVIIRLSVGNRRDNHAAEHIANCKKYGLKWHGYHYWYNLSGEAAFAISDAQSLGLTSSQYFFLDMEDKSLSSDWSVQFESFRSAVGDKYKIGLYCSDSPYKSHFDNAKMVAEGVYRWIAAYSYEPANYDTWQMSGEGSGGFGSYTGDVDRDYDKTGNLFKEEAQPITPSTTPLYRQIIGEAGYDTDSGIYGLGRSYDNGKTFHVMDTVYGRIYRQQDGDSIWPFLKDKVKSVLDWSAITNKPDVALKSDLTWSNVTGKPDVALKSDVAAVSAVASTASAKATSNAATIASVSSTASSALSVANSNAKVLPNKLDKADLTWSNVAGRPDVDKIASQASQAVVTANTAQSQASAAGQAASSASVQASAAKASADTATATANAAKASASTASATAASAQQVANSASASASATVVALKSKADTATVNAQFTAVNSSVASAQSTADSAVAGLAGKLDKTALTWGNIANKPTNLATTDSVAKAQSAANSAVSMASGATATANSAKSAATSAVGVANTANTTANSALTKANSAVSVASQANSNASSAVSIANSANNSASSAVNTANQAKSTADSVNSKVSNLLTSGRNYLKNSQSFTMTGNGTDNYDLCWDVYDSAFFTNPLCRGTNKTRLSFDLTPKKALSTAKTYRIYWRAVPWTSFGTITVPAGTTDKQHYELAITTLTTQNQASQIFMRFMADSTSDVSYTIEHSMLTIGDAFAEWQPAPEDIQSEIDANKTAAANAQASASNAQNTANSALSKANSNATTLETKITKSDLTWANISGKPSIPDDDATTTVSSGDLNNYTTTGKYYMPNSLANYTNHPTTGTDMGNWFVMKVDSYINGSMIIQTIYQINSGDVWIRQRWSGAWKSWRQINFWG